MAAEPYRQIKKEERIIMAQKKTKAIAIALTLAMMLPATLVGTSARGLGEGGASENEIYSISERAFARKEVGLKPIANKNIYTYSRKSINYTSLGKSGAARVINGMEYVALRNFGTAIGASVTYNSQTKTSTLKYGSFTLTVSDKAYVMYANGRPIFSLGNSVIMSDGLMYVPLSSVAKALGMRVSSGASAVSVSGRAAPMAAKAPYSEDEIFWLARIIEAESAGESLVGKIGVGTVVLNRVASPLYPNTIYGVIFDRKYGVQFSPVLDGRIYNTPSYQARLAARICLEGYRISDEALFFLAPEHSTSSWIPQSRRYIFSIMHHDFYA